jgi:hypothetical protein
MRGKERERTWKGGCGSGRAGKGLRKGGGGGSDDVCEDGGGGCDVCEDEGGICVRMREGCV